MWLFPLLVFSIQGIACLDSENNEPIFKFTIVAGSPDSLNGSSTSSVADFDECVKKCEEDVECVLAHQETPDTGPCYLFPWGSVTGVKSNASGEGGEGQVAFKVYTNQPACELNAVYLLNGKTYPLFSNDTEKYLWRIDTSESGWTLTYLPCASDDQQEKCGNWGALRPYHDSCNNECKLTMLQIYAQPGKILRPNNVSIFADTWMDCMISCYSSFTCMVVHYIEAEKKCNHYPQGILNVLTKKAPDDGHRMAIKAPTSNVTCQWTTEQLLNDTYYLPYRRVALYLYRQEYYRIQNFPNFYLIMYYAGEGDGHNYQQNCPSNFRAYWPNGKPTVVCQQPFYAENLTQPEAKEICAAMGGHLFVQREPYPDIEIYFDDDIGGRSWFLDNTTMKSFWFGLEKSPDCSKSKNATMCEYFGGWEWSEPSWIVFSDFRLDYKGGSQYNVTIDRSKPITWADGEPSSDPKKTCAYLVVQGRLPPLPIESYPRDYRFVSAECNSTHVDGFTCGAYPKTETGVRSYEDLIAEYGVEAGVAGYYEPLFKARSQAPPDNFVLMNETRDEL